MKYIKSYLKHNLHVICLLFFFLLMQTALFFLVSLPIKDAAYLLFIEVLVILIASLVDMTHYCQTFQQIDNLNNMELPDLSMLPKPRNDLEESYQNLLSRLNDIRLKLLVEEENNRRDMQDYYSMWVHQIKTPIAAMQLLLQTYGQDEEHFSTEITDDLERELFSINNYAEMALQYQRLNSINHDFVFHARKLDGIVRDAIRKYAKIMIQKKITLHYEKIDNTVVTDEKWLQFVIEQILSNAIKYTPHGSITISFKPAVLEEGKNTSYLLIKDTGIGIHAEDLPRVCENGYTGYNGHADKKSTGIGLYLCKQALTRMSHTIHLESEIGRGTTVYIGFPISQEE